MIRKQRKDERKNNHFSSTCLQTKYSLAVLHENALCLPALPNKKIIEVSWITITSGIPTFSNVFVLLVILLTDNNVTIAVIFIFKVDDH